MIDNRVSKHKRKFSKTESILDFKLRSSIYNFLLKNPGIHFRELVRKLNIPRTTLSYHLRFLEKNDLVITKKEGRYTRYFISNKVDNKEKTILSAIRQETTRNVLLYIVVMACASQNEIAKELAMHKTSVEFHLKKLLKNDLIEPARIENGILYTCYNNNAVMKRKTITNEITYTTKKPIYKFLLKYYLNGYYGGYISKTFLDVAEEVYPNGPPKKLFTIKEYVEEIEKIIYEIFPHPYHP